MKKHLLFCVLILANVSTSLDAQADTFAVGDNQFSIDFMTIGNPGNPRDNWGGDPITEDDNAGSVGYVYRIGKYEVSRDMVMKANVAGNLDISLHPLDFVTLGPRPHMPATGVTWNEAARFVNWLNTSAGHSPAYKFETQPGDASYDANEQILLWEPADSGYDANNLYRNSQAFYFLPSIDEWHKAAFYDPDANGGAGGYWDYANGSDSPPIPISSGTALGTAVWNNSASDGPADIMLAGGPSPFGVVGMAGNAEEWDETSSDLANDASWLERGVRQGYWGLHTAARMSAQARTWSWPEVDLNDSIGFRVASVAQVPEPSSIILGVLGAMALCFRRVYRSN